jgi:hypothetical protein
MTQSLANQIRDHLLGTTTDCHPHPAARPQPTTLTLEGLEDRQLLSAAIAAPVAALTVNPGGPEQPAIQITQQVVTPAVLQSLPILAHSKVDLPGSPISTGLPHGEPAQQLVITSASELLAATDMTTTQLAQRLKVSAIDWNTEMVVLVSQGFGGYGAASPFVNITNLNVTNGTLTVQWNLELPNPHQVFPYFMEMADPSQIVLTSQFNGPVTFQQGATVILPPPVAPTA